MIYLAFTAPTATDTCHRPAAAAYRTPTVQRCHARSGTGHAMLDARSGRLLRGLLFYYRSHLYTTHTNVRSRQRNTARTSHPPPEATYPLPHRDTPVRMHVSPYELPVPGQILTIDLPRKGALPKDVDLHHTSTRPTRFSSTRHSPTMAHVRGAPFASADTPPQWGYMSQKRVR